MKFVADPCKKTNAWSWKAYMQDEEDDDNTEGEEIPDT